MKTTLTLVQTEAQFESKVVELARLYGYTLIYHTWNSRHSAAGFPDLVLCRPGDGPQSGGKLIFLEVKAENGRVTPEQQQWIDALGTVPGITARVVKPSDFAEVERLLRGSR